MADQQVANAPPLAPAQLLGQVLLQNAQVDANMADEGAQPDLGGGGQHMNDQDAVAAVEAQGFSLDIQANQWWMHTNKLMDWMHNCITYRPPYQEFIKPEQSINIILAIKYFPCFFISIHF